MKPRIGITIGDINGIGPEVIIKTLENEYILSQCIPIVYGSAKVLGYHKNIVDTNSFSFVSILEAASATEGKINVITCWSESVNISLGEATEEGGQCAHIALDKAVTDLINQDIDALVTAPINKHAMKLANFAHLGHTEYLAERCGSKDYLMFLVSEVLRMALVTTHIPVSEISMHISKDAILNKIEILDKSLREDFGIERPLIAVLGLNPHAGDGAQIGTEDEKEILPAILEAKDKKIAVAGPYAADGLFGGGAYKKFDAILAMYHDQGLIPFKSLSFGEGVNFTAGLPVIRTSPDHGTAYDIAGQNKANPDSFRKSMFMAIDICRNRKSYYDMNADKIEKTQLTEEDGPN